MSKSIIEKNLEALTTTNPNLVVKIIDHKVTSNVEFKEAKSKDLVLSVNGYDLDDLNNPQEDSLRIFNNVKQDNIPDNIIIILGLGTGYLFKRFTVSSKSKIVVFEPSLSVMRIILESVDFSAELNNPNYTIANSFHEISQAFETLYKHGNKIEVVYNKQYENLYSDVVQKLHSEIKNILPEPYEGGPLKLNIGPGIWKKEGWKTLDYYVNATFNVDLRNMDNFPIEDNMIEKAFSSHCIEHIKQEHAEHLFREIYRCMKPGGILRLACPDADLALAAYKRKDRAWFSWVDSDNFGNMIINAFSSYKRGGPKCDDETVQKQFDTLSKNDFIKWCNSLIDPNEPYVAHTNGYYYEKLEGMLSEAGFAEIRKSGYRQSYDPELRGEMFDLYPKISLYVECCKPL